jgi:hypothetical protein
MVLFQQAFHRPLRMLLADIGPSLVGQVLIQTWQDHATLGRRGDHAQ